MQGKLKVAKINIDHNQKTPRNYNVRGIPTLMIFKDGKVAGDPDRRGQQDAARADDRQGDRAMTRRQPEAVRIAASVANSRLDPLPLTALDAPPQSVLS